MKKKVGVQFFTYFFFLLSSLPINDYLRVTLSSHTVHFLFYISILVIYLSCHNLKANKHMQIYIYLY